MKALHQQSLIELRQTLLGKQASAVEVAQHFLKRIQADHHGAFLAVNEEVTLAQAREADARLAKRMGRLTLMVDGFNLFNIGREVEEYVLTNANFRAITYIEPPRTLRIGAKYAF